MASWASSPSPSGRGVCRFGGHVLADRDLDLLRMRLVAMESTVANRTALSADDWAGGSRREAAHARVIRDLDLLNRAHRRGA